jgi:hypothetical protein
VQPFPCLLIDTGSGRIVAGNAVARAVGLDHTAGSSTDAYYATDAGGRVEAAELARHLLARAAGTEGAEVTWHAPDGRFTFRASPSS